MKTRWRGQQPPQIRFGKEVETILATLPKTGREDPVLVRRSRDGGNSNGLIQGNDGNFYGATQNGGSSFYRSVFRFSLPLQPIIQKGSQTNGIITFIWSSVASQNHQVQYNTDLNSTH